MQGFTDDPAGMFEIRMLTGGHAFTFGKHLKEIGVWAYENDYRLKLCYREIVVVDGVEHDCRECPAILMESYVQMMAFRLRWF